jgi:hypothetical protein
MNSRTYTIDGKEVKVTNRRILDIIDKAESLESLEKFSEAQKELDQYLLGEDCRNYLSMSQYMGNMSLWEAIAVGFDTLNEKYAEKFNPSGKIDSSTTLRSIPRDIYKEQMLKVSCQRAAGLRHKSSSIGRKEEPWDGKKLQEAEKVLEELGYWNVVKGLDKKLVNEPL